MRISSRLLYVFESHEEAFVTWVQAEHFIALLTFQVFSVWFNMPVVRNFYLFIYFFELWCLRNQGEPILTTCTSFCGKEQALLRSIINFLRVVRNIVTMLL